MTENQLIQTQAGFFGTPESQPQPEPIFFDPSKKIEGVTTSYTPETNEVISYREQIKSGDPSTLYEFLQNAFDYNDYTQGPPAIEVILKDGQILQFSDLFKINDEQQFLDIQQQASQVRITNHIDEKKYYKIEHLVQTRHGGDEGTLGQHGRGGKAGSTALINEGCVSSITFSSRDENGPWKAKGEVGVRPELFSHQTTPSYNILYQESSNEDQSVDKTVVTFNNPDLKFFQLLFKIPQKFLLVNPEYQGYQLEDKASLQPKENPLTIWVDQADFPGDRATTFSKEEAALLSLPNIEFTQQPRVEILPEGIVPQEKRNFYEETTMGICVDGLLLSNSKEYVLQWSFWGCGHGKDHRWDNNGYYIYRSAESRYAQGEWDKLMALALGKCTNPELFKKILDYSHSNNSCKEGDLPKEEFSKALNAHPQAMTAFKTAWQLFAKEQGITAETLVTANEYTTKVMKEANKPVFCLNAPSFLDVIIREKLVGLTEQQVMIDKKPEKTGDSMKFSLDSLSPDTAIDRLFEIIIERDNQIKKTKKGMQIELSFLENSPPASFHHLSSTTRDFIRDFYSYGGDNLKIEIIFDTGLENSKRYLLSSKSNWFSDSRSTNVDVSSGVVESRVERANKMIIKLEHDQEETTENFEQLIKKFFAEFNKVSADGESVDLDLFAEKYSGVERGVFNAEVMAQKRAMMEQMNKLEEEKRKLGIIFDDSDALDSTRKSLRYNPKFKRAFTTLFSPDSNPIASNGKKRKQQSNSSEKMGLVDMIDRLNEHLDSLKNPDLHLINPHLLPAYSRTTLVATITPRFSGEIRHSPYQAKPGKLENKAAIKVNQQIIHGTHAVPTPLDCQLVGYYHPDPKVQETIQFAAALDKNLFSIQANDIIPPGLELYFEHHPENSVHAPASIQENQEMLDVEKLPKQWKKLVETINGDNSLDEKQKADIILTAWLHSFTYDDDPEIDDLVKEKITELTNQGIEPEKARYLAIINVSKGNCGYVSEGFLSLARAVGLQSTEAIGYLGDNGRFFPGPHNHGINLVKINGGWTYVEPQRGYLSDSIKREAVPAKYKSIIRRLPRGIKKYDIQNVARESTGIRDIIKELHQRQLTGDESVKKVLQEMVQLMGEDAEKYQYLWQDESPNAGLSGLDEVEQMEPSLEKLLKLLSTQNNNQTVADIQWRLQQQQDLRNYEQEKAEQLQLELNLANRKTKIATAITAAAVAAAVTSIALSSSGIELGAISLPEITLHNLNLPSLISQVFNPSMPEVAAIPKTVEIPIFTWKDIKIIAAALFSVGTLSGVTLSQVASLVKEIRDDRRYY